MGDDEEAESLLRDRLLNMRGFNYYLDVTICREGDSLWLRDSHTRQDCREYFDWIIGTAGYRLGNTHFYAIRIFDGYVTYLGRFRIGDAWVYLRFDAGKDDEGIGYPQLLSRKSSESQDVVYHYSYAKYLHGELAASAGDFIYTKQLKPWAERTGESVRVVIRDNYSHMLVAVNDYDTLIISLPEYTFALYYMNTLYAFLICMVVSSYGMFFNANDRRRIQGRTLKTSGTDSQGGRGASGYRTCKSICADCPVCERNTGKYF